ncbi:MAG: hypothetical protein QGF62_02980 [Gammaproteobacteria bacterium]|nr:hypothetical protein [Gammaproteobacteria bacterium]
MEILELEAIAKELRVDVIRMLVEAGIAVTELVIKRDSLGSLFREITSGQQS